MNHRRLWPAALTFIACSLVSLALATTANATVAVPLSRAQMYERSSLVVHAAVIAQVSEWNADHSQIVTLTRLRVSTYLKGNAGPEITLRQFGGTVDGMSSRVAGDAQFSQGQDFVLFLREGDGVVFLTALAQAAYYVEHDAHGALYVRRDLHELTFATPQAGQFTLIEPTEEPRESLDALVHSVTALRAGAR